MGRKRKVVKEEEDEHSYSGECGNPCKGPACSNCRGDKPAAVVHPKRARRVSGRRTVCCFCGTKARKTYFGACKTCLVESMNNGPMVCICCQSTMGITFSTVNGVDPEELVFICKTCVDTAE